MGWVLGGLGPEDGASWVVRMEDWVQEEETVSRHPKSAGILILSSKLLAGSIFRNHPGNSIIAAGVGWGFIFQCAFCGDASCPIWLPMTHSR